MANTKTKCYLSAHKTASKLCTQFHLSARTCFLANHAKSYIYIIIIRKYILDYDSDHIYVCENILKYLTHFGLSKRIATTCTQPWTSLIPSQNTQTEPHSLTRVDVWTDTSKIFRIELLYISTVIMKYVICLAPQ